MKGVIVAAGYGTRFLPVTKTVPKELLPVGVKPAIAYIVEEFLSAGIDEIIVISSRRKKVLEDYFDREVELEGVFRAEGRTDKLSLVESCRARVAFVRQSEMLGTGHALMQVAPFLNGEPCVVAYPDDLHIGNPPLARQLVDVYEKTGKSVLATILEPGDVSRYGVVGPDPDGVSVVSFVEKPTKGAEPSHEVSIGRYLYTPDFFDLLEEGWAKHSGGEYFHTYALDKLIAAGKVAFKRTEGLRLDTGSPEGYFEAILENAASDPALRPVLERFVRGRM
jgi:UTP--glucose-1-phosphate uridylyltransferase